MTSLHLTTGYHINSLHFHLLVHFWLVAMFNYIVDLASRKNPLIQTGSTVPQEKKTNLILCKTHQITIGNSTLRI